VTEAELIEQAGRGDPEAWEIIVRHEQEAVFRLCYLLVGNAGDAEDVAQETFIRAYRYLERFDRTRRLRPWLLGIAAHLAGNRRRTWGRYLHHLGRLARLVPEATIDPEQETVRRADAQALWQAIRRLEASDQEIIYLRYFLELSVDETAEALQVADGTVKSRLSRAVARLRRVMQDEFPHFMGRMVDE